MKPPSLWLIFNTYFELFDLKNLKKLNILFVVTAMMIRLMIKDDMNFLV